MFKLLKPIAKKLKTRMTQPSEHPLLYREVGPGNSPPQISVGKPFKF